MKKYIISLLAATMFLSGCAHTTASSSYMSSSYNNNSSTIENIIGFGILAAATTGIVLAAINSDSDDYSYHDKNSFPDKKHNNKHPNHHNNKPKRT